MRFILFIGLFLIGFMPFVHGQTAHSSLRNADAAYMNDEYATAEELYRTAAVAEPSAQAKFNLGNSLYQQERYEEAAEEFQQAVNLSNDTMFRAKALYNKGNSLLQKGDLGESLNSYKKSLLLNPTDEDAKRNFMLALQQQQQEQKQEQQEQQEQEQQEENQENEQEPQDQQNEQEQQQQNKEQEQKEAQEAQPDDKEMTREEAEQLLQIIENTDGAVQKKLKKQNSTKKQGDKNW